MATGAHTCTWSAFHGQTEGLLSLSFLGCLGRHALLGKTQKRLACLLEMPSVGVTPGWTPCWTPWRPWLAPSASRSAGSAAEGATTLHPRGKEPHPEDQSWDTWGLSIIEWDWTLNLIESSLFKL